MPAASQNHRRPAAAKPAPAPARTTATCLVLLATSACSLVALVSQAQQPQQGSCHLRELDLCAASMLVLVQAPGGLATSDPEIQKQCLHLREADACLRNYTRRCATPLQRELITWAANASLVPLLDDYCTKGSKLRLGYLKHAKCFQQLQKQHSAEQKQCLRDLQAPLELLVQHQPQQQPQPAKPTDKQRPQLACCAYRRFESCMGGLVERRCGKEALQFVQTQIVRRAVSRLPELVCRNYKPDGQECAKLLPKSGAGSPPAAAGAAATSRGSRSSGSIVARLLAAYAGL